MQSTLATDRSRTAAGIWQRIVRPGDATYAPDLARSILKWDFDPEDHRRIDALSIKAQEGTLTPQEVADLDEYVRVNDLLTAMQAKARLSLKKAGERNK